MTSENDRLLAEGPRLAPEAPMVSDGGAVVSATPAPLEPKAAVEHQDGGKVFRPSGSRGRSSGLAKPFLGRAWLPLFFAAIAFASAGGHGYVWVAPILLVGLAWFRIWRQR